MLWDLSHIWITRGPLPRHITIEMIEFSWKLLWNYSKAKRTIQKKDRKLLQSILNVARPFSSVQSLHRPINRLKQLSSFDGFPIVFGHFFSYTKFQLDKKMLMWLNIAWILGPLWIQFGWLKWLCGHESSTHNLEHASHWTVVLKMCALPCERSSKWIFYSTISRYKVKFSTSTEWKSVCF